MGARTYGEGISPFLSERARERVPEILSYAAVVGAAFLIAPTGEIVSFTGAAMEVDVDRIARALLHRDDEITSFHYDTRTCVYAARVSLGWSLCVISSIGIPPTDIIYRLKRASDVLALALADGSAGGSPSSDGGNGSAAEARVDLPTRRRN